MYSQASVILSTGGVGQTPPRQTHPSGQTPPQADTPPLGRHTIPGRHPPPMGRPPRYGHCCGRYTYWNAFLFLCCFSIVDMRWGIRDAATNDHMTTEICLSEIQKCMASSLPGAPCFMYLSFDRYA